MQTDAKCYMNSKKGWMSHENFEEWHRGFCEHVEAELQRQNRPIYSVLLVDNYGIHKSTIMCKDGKHVILFLPPNSTAFIQPCDQEVISTLKQIYNARLFDRFCRENSRREDPGIGEFRKNLKLGDLMDTVTEAWEQISPKALRHGWKPLLNQYLARENVELTEDSICTENH